jgi:hypothetical protein
MFVLLLSLAVVIPPQAEQETRLPKEAIEAVLKSREQAIKDVQAWVARAKSPEDKQRAKDRLKVLEGIRDRSVLGKPGPKTPLQRLLEWQELNDSIPIAEPTSFRVGFIGKLPSEARPLVLHVRNENEMVIRWGIDMALRGFTTKNLVDGQRVEVPGVLRIKETTKYGSSTIFLIEPFAIPHGLSDEELKQAKAEADRIVQEQNAAKAAAAEKARKDAEAKAAADAVRAKEVGAVQREADALRKLKLAKLLLEDKDKRELARKRLQAVVDGYPGTKAAAEAKALLDK